MHNTITEEHKRSTEQFFLYGEKEIAYLKNKDKRLGEVIDKVGMVKRQVIPDLFTALVHSIVGQQISTKAHNTIWLKMVDAFGEITPEKVLSISPEELQSFGITFKKVDYIRTTAHKIVSGEFDIKALVKWTTAKFAQSYQNWTALAYGQRKC